MLKKVQDCGYNKTDLWKATIRYEAPLLSLYSSLFPLQIFTRLTLSGRAPLPAYRGIAASQRLSVSSGLCSFTCKAENSSFVSSGADAV